MPTKTLLKYMGRGKAATTAEAKAREPAARREARTATGLPAGGYDTLSVDKILGHLGELTETDLAKLGDYERSHQNRAAVLAGIDALGGAEPWPDYEELDVTGVLSGLEGADRERLGKVLAYERGHKNRADILLAAQQQPAEGLG